MRHLLLRPDDPEVLTLRDALMAKSVEAQLERFQYMNERGQGMWLSQAWEAHAKDAPPGGGAAFLDALTRTESIEAYFVPTIARRQGSPNNPYLNRAASGYHTTIDPRDLARRLMACRSQLAGEWCEQLRILATGEPHERLAEEALLLGLSARAAMRSLLRGLKPLPSRRGMHAFLEARLPEITRDYPRLPQITRARVPRGVCQGALARPVPGGGAGGGLRGAGGAAARHRRRGSHRPSAALRRAAKQDACRRRRPGRAARRDRGGAHARARVIPRDLPPRDDRRALMGPRAQEARPAAPARGVVEGAAAAHRPAAPRSGTRVLFFQPALERTRIAPLDAAVLRGIHRRRGPSSSRGALKTLRNTCSRPEVCVFST